MNDAYLDDSVLIRRFGAGDTHALDALFTKHQARAYQFAYRLSKDQDLASDVVAEAFVRVYRSLSNFKGESSFTTWLYRIITNCYLDLNKKAKSRPVSSLDTMRQHEDGETELQIVDESLSPHHHAEVSERSSLVAAAIQQLPPYQKAMIVMFHVEMLSYEEIAQTLDLPLGTVKSRLNRARLNLRNLLGTEADSFAAA